MTKRLASTAFKRALRRAARACEAALGAAGARAVVVGSLAYGDVRPDSDLDLLILAHPGRSWAEVNGIAADAALPYGVTVDVIFAETLPPAVRRAMLKDARPPRTPSPRARAAGTRRSRS